MRVIAFDNDTICLNGAVWIDNVNNSVLHLHITNQSFSFNTIGSSSERVLQTVDIYLIVSMTYFCSVPLTFYFIALSDEVIIR